MPRKSSLASTVLHPVTLPAFLTHLVSQPTPGQTTLIVCSSRSAFLSHLLASLTPATQPDDQDQGTQPLLPPTLRTLLASQRIRLVFCASVPALQAYLAAYSGPAEQPTAGLNTTQEKKKEEEEEGHPVLVLLNPLALHAPTPAFSAQGLGRSFAAAVEAAWRGCAKLVVVECVGAGAGGRRRRMAEGEGEGEGVDMDLGLGLDEDARGEEGREEHLDSREEDPWEQSIPILNGSVRRFGSRSGERGWVGRTVKVRRVVERWCRFSSLESIENKP